MSNIATDVARLKPESYVDNRIYSSQRIFEEEQENIFKKCWLFVAHESELPEIGSYRRTEAGGLPLLLVRDPQNRIRAYLNSCRHRGCLVGRSPCEQVKQFTCIYHRWTYSLGGELVGTGAELSSLARADGYDDTGFDKADFPLHEVKCETWKGLVFVSHDTNADTLENYLAGVIDFAAPLFSRPLEVFHFHQATLQTNWKMIVENDRELYHLFLHSVYQRGSKQKMERGSGGVRWQDLGNGHLGFYDQEKKAVDFSGTGHDEEGSLLSPPMPGLSDGATALIYIYPDFMINVKTSIMRIDRVLPHSPSVSVAEFRGLGEAADTPEVRRNRQRAHGTFWGPFGRILPEDMVATSWQYEAIGSRDAASKNRWTVIAREEDMAAMDDASLRLTYAEWADRMGYLPSQLPSHVENL